MPPSPPATAALAAATRVRVASRSRGRSGISTTPDRLATGTGTAIGAASELIASDAPDSSTRSKLATSVRSRCSSTAATAEYPTAVPTLSASIGWFEKLRAGARSAPQPWRNRQGPPRPASTTSRIAPT